jgi:hypothetical protein
MFEPPGLRVIVIWIVGAVIAGVAVLASGRQSWWPAGGFCLCAAFLYHRRRRGWPPRDVLQAHIKIRDNRQWVTRPPRFCQAEGVA